MPRAQRIEVDALTAILPRVGRHPFGDIGDPQVAQMAFDCPSGVNAGVWECTPGGWQIENRSETEVVFVLSGRATITESGSDIQHQIGPGDIFIQPKGWSGRWNVTETIRKVYFTSDAR